MSRPEPVYTARNVSPAWQLVWAVTVFWRESPFASDWLAELAAVLEADGIRLLAHQFAQADRSQFLASTRPDVKPVDIVHRIKGRLQFLIRDQCPKAFRRNYDLHSVGSTSLEKVVGYVAKQLSHHGFEPDVSFRSLAEDLLMSGVGIAASSGDLESSSNLSARLNDLQWQDPDVDLSQPRFTAHARFRCNLHFVSIHTDRWQELRIDKWHAVREIIRKAARVKGHLLSRIGLLPDHFHLVLGFSPEESPLAVALSYMNNVAFVYDMERVLAPGCYIGTVGNYDLGSIAPTAWLR